MPEERGRAMPAQRSRTMPEQRRRTAQRSRTMPVQRSRTAQMPEQRSRNMPEQRSRNMPEQRRRTERKEERKGGTREKRKAGTWTAKSADSPDERPGTPTMGGGPAVPAETVAVAAKVPGTTTAKGPVATVVRAAETVEGTMVVRAAPAEPVDRGEAGRRGDDGPAPGPVRPSSSDGRAD